MTDRKRTGAAGPWADGAPPVSIEAFHAGVAAGTVKDCAWLDHAVDTIAEKDGDIHAFLRFDVADARARFRSGGEGPLAGIPVAVKDNLVHRGGPTTCASRILEDFHSPWDATVVDRLQRAGGFLLGKTNLDEFAMGSSTEHSAFGPTRNPLDLDRVPGGSSGGSAAAVAAGMAPVALGTDTGGSVRQPAAFCGILGLKPTWGRVSRRGLVAFASSLDQVGILARHASDAAAVLGVIAGADPGDSTCADVPVPDYRAGLEEGIGGKRFGVIREALDLLEGDARAAFEQSVDALKKGGARVETVSIPLLPRAVAIYFIVANAEASANLARYDGVRYGRRAEGAKTIEELYLRSRSEGFGPEVKRRIMLGTFALSSGYYDAYYGRAQRARRELVAEFDAAVRSVDGLLTPTTPTAAFRLGEKVEDPVSMYLSDVFTVPANLAGIPAIAIPSERDRDGLPLSLQVMGRPWEEGSLLAVAAWMEGMSSRA
ncbi:MAG TPA: Asp-tRNA(Asn)/Glu-tRNA(Gln) amidotransferase subunit GatA [Thermoanaerobaculia bacterium]